MSDLVQDLGGYAAAKKFLEKIKDNKAPHEILCRELLEHRRANNIFEKGDDIIFAIVGNGIMKWDDCLAMFVSQGLVRHATDGEIKAGRRLWD